MFRLYGDASSALFVSGGGNDFAAFSDLRPMLRQIAPQPARLTSASCPTMVKARSHG